jgi:hypothetical protein
MDHRIDLSKTAPSGDCFTERLSMISHCKIPTARKSLSVIVCRATSVFRVIRAYNFIITRSFRGRLAAGKGSCRVALPDTLQHDSPLSFTLHGIQDGIPRGGSIMVLSIQYRTVTV